MKKIIAAALSVLIGSLGLTVVDKTLESRVATLESEVVELREEVSNYHPQYTTSPYEGSEVFTTEEQNYTTTEAEDSTGINIGDFLYESSNSKRKFLIREYDDGTYIYIPSNSYEPVSFVQKTTSTTVPITETRPFNSSDELAPDDPEATCTTVYATNEYFLYLTDVSAQWTETEEEISYSYSYDKDYSQVSTPHITERNYVTIRYKGYTDPELAGKRINFVLDSSTPEQISITNNVIDENGGFDFEVVYCYPSTPYHYCINSIRIY